MKNLIKNNWFIFGAIYLCLRLFSYFFPPVTPLFSENILNSILTATIWYTVICLFQKNEKVAWLIVAGELILGGSGGFLAIHGVSLRLLFLLTAAFFYFFKKIKNRDKTFLTENSKISLGIIVLGACAALSFTMGWYLKNKFSLVVSDFIPYLFLFYFFPLRELLRDEEFKKNIKQMLAVAIIGNLLFTVWTFFSFSFGLFVLQGEYYHWFRDIALGKITDMGSGFYRIVLNEHLLIVPLLLYFLKQRLNGQKEKIISILILSGILILSINITRIYFVALCVGLLFLFDKTQIKKWLLYCITTGLVLLSSFMIFHLIGSRGQNLGLEFFGIRLQSIASPQIEDSSLSRMLILPKAWEKINESPLLGHGLGDEVTVYSPILKQEITTGQYDWGWLEIWVENGIVGLFAWTGLLYLSIQTVKNTKLFASFISFLFINITSPALFHVFGIILLVAVLTNKEKICS